MIVENLTQNYSSIDKQKILAQAQTIANFFIDALEQNDCNVKIVVGFYQEINDTMNAIDDLTRAFTPTTLSTYYPPNPDMDYYNIGPEDPATDPVVIQAAINALKEKCFNCQLKFPKINFSADIKFLFDKLTVQLSGFEAVFKNFNKESFCHASLGLQKTCIPDLVKLIAMLLSAYLAIMALRKLPSLTLHAFIKGVIGPLIQKIVKTLSLSIDVSSTGLPCLIATLRELALKIPTDESLNKGLTPQEKAVSHIKNYVSVADNQAMLQGYVEKGKLTTQEYQQMTDWNRKRADPINFYTDKLEKQVNDATNSINKIFRTITDTVDKAQLDLNKYIEEILAVVTYLECESGRTGSNFTEIIAYMNQLVQVINMISSLVKVLFKNTLPGVLCMDGASYDDIVKALDSTVAEPLTAEDLAEVLQEFTGAVSKVNQDGLAVLIYDKPYQQTLPKLSLLGCNLVEFAQAHTLDNIIKSGIQDFIKESKQDTLYTDPINLDGEAIVLPPEFTSKPKPPGKDIFNSALDGLSADQKQLFNNIPKDAGSLIYPPLEIEVLQELEQIANSIIDTTKNKLPLNQFIKLLNPNFPLLTKFTNYVQTQNEILTYTTKVIDKIEINKLPINDVYKGYADSIDEIMDFIYNGPLKPIPNAEVSTPVSIDPVTNVPNPSTPSTLNIHNDILIEEQKAQAPILSECKSVDDVIAILNTIKI